jgi:hypothetical protein
MVMHAKDLMGQYQILGNDNNKVFIDGSASGFIRSLKYQTNEKPHYENIIEKARQDGLEDQLHLYMNIVPVNFSTKGKSMLDNLKKYIDMGKVALDAEQHRDLLTELRIATSDEELRLVKDQTNSMDLLDSLRLACCFVK